MDIVSYCVTQNRFGTNCVTQDKGDTCLFRILSVNPDFRPVPVGMTLFGIRNDTVNNITQLVTEVMDPYEKKTDYIYIMVWAYSVPNTIPIYVAYSPSTFSTLLSRTPIPENSLYNQRWTWYVLDEKIGPNFQFVSKQELCIPTSSGGSTLTACVLSESINPTILQYVGYFRKFDTIKRTNSELYLVIILFAFIFFTFIIKYVLARFEYKGR